MKNLWISTQKSKWLSQRSTMSVLICTDVRRVVECYFPCRDGCVCSAAFSLFNYPANKLVCMPKKKETGGKAGTSTCLNYWITHIWSSVALRRRKHHSQGSRISREAMPAQFEFQEIFISVWIRRHAGDLYHVARIIPASLAAFCRPVVLQSTRLGRTNVGVPARHVCKGASYSPDADLHRWYRFCCPLGKFDTKSTHVYLRISLGYRQIK